MIRWIWVFPALTALGGCAGLPDATVRYYLPQTKLGFKVVRTVACDGSTQLVLANAVTPTVVHFADLTQKQEVTLSALKGTFSDTDVGFNFYDDGRLKGFNGTSTGEGETILKTVISVVGAFYATDGGGAHPKECAEIKKDGGDKPLTITYSDEVSLSNSGGKQTIKADITSTLYAAKYKDLIGTVCAVVESPSPPTVPVAALPSKVMLHLREPAVVHVKVFAGDAECTLGPAWEGDVQAAQLGKFYDLPIPTPVLFGKEALVVSLSESGALASVQFTSNTGAGQALNVVSAAQSAVKPETTAQKANDVKAEADLIAQQQRLVGCLADPKSCK